MEADQAARQGARMTEQGRGVGNGAQGPQPLRQRRRRWLAASLTLLTVLLVLFVSVRGRFARKELPAAVEVPPLGSAPTTLVPGIHFLGGLFPSVAYVVETSAGLVLIDTGL